MSKQKATFRAMQTGVCVPPATQPCWAGSSKDGRLPCFNCPPFLVANEPSARHLRTIADVASRRKA